MSGFDAPDLERLADIVRTAARAEILPRFRRLGEDDTGAKTSAEDLVTVADTSMEAALETALAAVFPAAAIVGEEAVFADPGRLGAIADADLAFIVDPIDGTWNFAHGLPLFGTIVAVTARGETIGGLIYDPLGEDHVAALRGAGAVHADASGTARPLGTAPGGELRGMTGYVPVHLFPAATREGLARATLPFLRVNSLRCSAYEYRTLAQGSADFALNAELKPWDHAAGQLIHAEAGGYSALIDGTPYSPALTRGHLMLAPDRDSWDMLAAHFRAQGGF